MKRKQQLKAQPNRLIIWPAKGMFKSAKKLKVALQQILHRKVLLVRSDSFTFKARLSDVIVNWGNSKWPTWAVGPAWMNLVLINDPDDVAIATNKLATFLMLQGKCNIPEWTTNKGEVTKEEQWLARTKLNGYGGEGIIIFNPKEELPPDAPLYVQYKKKKKEFRVHVFKGEVIDITQKKKRSDFDGEINTKIRNYGNGWVYCREGIEPLPDDLKEQAICAVKHLGLLFGAVDIIWNEKENKSYVLEVNTAPGLEGTTIQSYANAIVRSL